MTETNYSLKWNEFESMAANTFKDLVSDNNFSDVTLVCEDGQQINAHKIILSSCSDFFRNILLKNSHPQPLIYLDNVNADQLEALINFMYLGETNIPQDMFSDFIKAAQKYKIKGLAEQDGEIPPPPAKKKRNNVLKIKEEMNRDKTNVVGTVTK